MFADKFCEKLEKIAVHGRTIKSLAEKRGVKLTGAAAKITDNSRVHPRSDMHSSALSQILSEEKKRRIAERVKRKFPSKKEIEMAVFGFPITKD